ncbi:MAG: hypothetical protein RQ868_04440 [Meiothermus sp.]|uniref:DUF6683 family protein n=1 Tax=Meiothermus sp. TaxID=1955249 RepID=UPI0028CCDEE0|nr:DUF6683 family protein [Meiothermus sp.]MDT7919819.1 hypothetical protein [Meiothermus sp.]
MFRSRLALKAYLLGCLLLVCSAKAQFIAGGGMVPITNFETMWQANMFQLYANAMNTSQMEINRIILGSLGRKSSNTPSRPSTPSTSNNPSNRPTPSATSFQPSPSPLLIDTLTRTLSKDRETQSLLKELFSEGQKLYEEEARRLGRSHNLAMALSYFVGSCYMVASGREPSEASLLAFQATADEALGASPAFKKLSNRERQTLYELFVHLTTLPLAGYVAALENNNPQEARVFQQLAAQLLELVLGVKPERLQFGPDGLTIR